LVCDLPTTRHTSDSVAALIPSRGWQMVGREIELTITSPPSVLTSKVTPVVCFGWKPKDSTTKTKFVEMDSVRILQRPAAVPTPQASQPVPQTAPTPQPAPQTSAPAPTPQLVSLKLAAPIPYFKDWPTQGTTEYTADNSSPVGEVRVLLLDADKLVDEVLTTVAIVGYQDYCNVPILGTRVDSGTVVPSISKAWQPAGGEIEFTAKSPIVIPTDAMIRVCFRWKLSVGDPGPFRDSGPIRVIEKQTTPTNAIKLAAQVPEIGGETPSFFEGDRVGTFAVLGFLVRMADVRVLLFDSKLDVVFDTWTKAGVTSVWIAGIITALVVLGAFVLLSRLCRRRIAGNKHANAILCLIATRNGGYASLSQFQIMLWTFVVIASSVYVMSLSGDLIPITAGTLVLLGISGAATVISKAKSENDAAAPPPPLDPAAAAAEAKRAEDAVAKAREAAAARVDTKEHADAESAVREQIAKAAAAKAKAEAAEATAAAGKLRAAVATATDKAKAEADAATAEALAVEKRKAAAIAVENATAAMRVRHPRWSDLVMDEVKGTELDVTRLQMLCFTLVTAVFVVLKVMAGYEIPVIPEGFLILMGISNSVYVTSKFANNPAAVRS